jgi:hypothetical protein
MIHGAHVIVFSKDARADLAFLRGLLADPKTVDAGGGWLIAALPPAEIAVHPSESNGAHQLYLMCDDIAAFRRTMAERRVPCSEVREQRWGLLVDVTLPGGGSLGVYEPRHASPNERPKASATRAPAKKLAKKVPAKKAPAKKPAKKAAKRVR